MRRIAATWSAWSANTSGISSVPALSATRSESWTLPCASMCPTARRCSQSTLDASTPSGAISPSASATAIAANWCGSTTPKRMPGVLLDLLLETRGEVLVGLRGHHGQRVDVEPADPLAVLVDAQPEPAADRLPPLALRPDVPKGADLEDVRVVPAFPQR